MSEILNKKHLDFDPLLEAEKITGKSYKEDEDTNSLGVALHILHNQDKQRRLSETLDTYYNQGETHFFSIVKELGFEKVYSEKFRGQYNEDEISAWVLKEGVLLIAETFGWNPDEERHINKASIYYNIKPIDNDVSGLHRNLSSGGFYGKTEDLFWSGNHDVREALRYKLGKLRKHGKFITPWKKQPFIGFVPYNCEKSYEGISSLGWYTEAANARLAALPDHVKEFFGICMEK